MDPWKMFFLLNMGIFHCHVSLPEGKSCCFGAVLSTFLSHILISDPLFHGLIRFPRSLVHACCRFPFLPCFWLPWRCRQLLVYGENDSFLIIRLALVFRRCDMHSLWEAYIWMHSLHKKVVDLLVDGAVYQERSLLQTSSIHVLMQ